MKQLSIILLATVIFASCKRKDNLETDKNIVIMSDTSRAAGSYLNDTGLAKMPVAVAPVAAAPAPTRRTTTSRQRSSTRYGNSTSTSTNNSTVNNSGSGTVAQPQRRGISKAAKGAIIGGVGGAVIGVYHGVRLTAAGAIYRLGLALLDAEHPDRVLARSNEWIFGPDAPYERTGDVGQVVFSCGWLLLDDGDTLRIYYGAADTSVCVATASLTALLRWLANHSG